MNTVTIFLPKLGESVAEATLTKWQVKPGDTIEKDEILCEIGTDKVESELPSEFSGVVKELLFAEGNVIQVGQAIATIETEDDIAAKAQPEHHNETGLPENNSISANQNQEKLAANFTTESTGFLSPVVRKMIAKHEISQQDVLSIKGSGSNNRITKKDIEQFLKSKSSKLQRPNKLQLPIVEEDTVTELSRTRKLIAEKLTQASQWIPHVTSFVEVDVQQVMNWKKEQQEKFVEQHNTKLSLTHCMMYAVIQSLKAFPQLNSWLNGTEWILKQAINLGFAVAINDDQLLVPNIKQAQNYSFSKFVQQVNETIQKAKTKQLTPDQLQHATFTVSNTGIYGSVMGTPIITAPQVAILAFGAIQRKPVVQIENEIEQLTISSVMNCSLSYDHRVIDGKLASEFLSHVKQNIEAFSI